MSKFQFLESEILGRAYPIRDNNNQKKLRSCVYFPIFEKELYRKRGNIEPAERGNVKQKLKYLEMVHKIP